MKTLILTAALVAAALAGCTSPSGVAAETFTQAGSSTVLPVAQAWAEAFEERTPSARFVVSGGGTGAGFKQFCRGEIDIADASRPIKAAERADCAAAGVSPFEIPVAIDGLAVVVSRENTFVDNLTVQELNRIWTQNTSKQATRWSQVRAGWPDQPIQLFGPGTDSGTFDYFVEVIIHPFDGSSSKGRSDYTPSEDDNVLVQGVRSSPHALAYFGLAYALENAATVRIVPIDEGKGRGPVTPTAETVEGGEYRPLSRPIFMYTNGPPNGTLREYFAFGLGDAGQALVEEVGYIKVPTAQRTETLGRIGG